MANDKELPIDRLLGNKYPEVLRTMAVELYVSLSSHVKLGQVLPSDEIAAVAFRATEAVRMSHGGFSFYVGKGVTHELSSRDREIYSRFDGANYDALAKQYDLTEMRVRQIINTCREEERCRRQNNLF